MKMIDSNGGKRQITHASLLAIYGASFFISSSFRIINESEFDVSL